MKRYTDKTELKRLESSSRMNLNQIVEAPIDPTEVSEALIAMAMQKHLPGETVEEFLTKFARLELETVMREATEEAIGEALYYFACKQVKTDRIKKALDKAFSDIEAEDKTVKTILMPIKEYKVFREYIDKESYDPVGQYYLIKAGLMGFLWSARVFVDLRPKDQRLKETVVTEDEYEIVWEKTE